MAYESNKDVVVVDGGEFEADGATFQVAAMRYDGGPVKIAITRKGTKKDGTPWSAPAGRMTPTEIVAVVDRVARVLAKLQAPVPAGAPKVIRRKKAKKVAA